LVTILATRLGSVIDTDLAKPIGLLKERYKCPYFRILIIGRINSGKTTILEKVCGVQQGTKPIIYNKAGELN
jgi:stage III sporulation protein SpoIIIAA